MRRALFAALLPAITALATLALVGVAQASGLQGSRTFDPFIPYDAPTICPHDYPGMPGAFGVSVSPVGGQGNLGNEYMMQLPDGTTLVTGNLVLSFQNDVNPLVPPIVRNESGPEFISSDFSNGTGTIVYRGNTALTLGPRSQHALALAGEPEPGLVFTAGNLVITFVNGAATSFSLSGTQVNGCALLAG
jgi:hypothetical protein